MTRKFRYNCISPTDSEELQYIVTNSEGTDYLDFVRHVSKEDLEDIKEDLGYVKGSLPTLKDDWAVEYSKCYLPKKRITAYILISSRVEYVFY